MSILFAILFLLIAAYLRMSGLLITVMTLIGVAVGDILSADLSIWLYIVVAILSLPFILKPVRQLWTKPFFSLFKKIAPKISDTEQAAIDTGTVWWDAELFKGKPDYQKLINYPDPKLTPEEQAFIDGPVEELCKMLNDWQINHELKDLPPEAWKFIKEKGFLGMIIKKKYGGLEFSHYAHAKVVTKIATRCGSAAVTVMVPNSLGPGELLQNYGLPEQQDYYLPRLAKGEEIPCFALTSPFAGSDAGGIPDYGVVCKSDFKDPITGEEKKDVVGVRVSWEKRWITLAPVATVLGLAFKLFDPDHILGDKHEIGITCALVPTKLKGVHIGRRHFPSGSVFQNGPTWGADVFIPLEYIIGGIEKAGHGWIMLMDCLSIGRCISLPANSVAAGKMSTYTTGLYARIRDQFGLPIGKFEGVDEAMARIAGNTYQMEAAQDLALTGLDLGEKPGVISAILKYNNTERYRKTVCDAMDVHGGRTVVLGPRNYLAQAYQAIPVAITVEGANILTRSLMIFGQGAFRCHPLVLKEMMATQNDDFQEFDKLIAEHGHFGLTNAVRSFWLGITNGAFTSAPRGGISGKYYRKVTRLAASYALLVDMSMASVGGALKFKEKLSARLGDVLSGLYIATACLKRFEKEGFQKEDEPIFAWAVESALFDAEDAMYGVLQNLPNRFVAALLKVLIFPLGRRLHKPDDKTGTKVAKLMMENGGAMERLTTFAFKPEDPTDPVGILPIAHKAVIETEATEKAIRKMVRNGELLQPSPRLQLQEALDKGKITQDEFDKVTRARKLKRDVVMVDDFDAKLEKHDDKLLDRFVF